MPTDPRLPTPTITTVYGRDTCEDTVRANGHLAAAGVPFHYVNLDLEPAARELLVGLGYVATPTVITPAGRIEVEPSDATLEELVASLRAA